MKDPERLTDRQERYTQHLAAGMDSQAAAKKAGYSDSFAKVAGFRMKHKPSVAKAIDAIRDEGRKLAVYDLAKAMEESLGVIEFAKLHKHPTAYFFAVRHRAHLSGLLIDKIQLETTVEQKLLEMFSVRPRPMTQQSFYYVSWCPVTRHSYTYGSPRRVRPSTCIVLT